jgi:hypothetical protein
MNNMNEAFTSYEGVLRSVRDFARKEWRFAPFG